MIVFVDRRTWLNQPSVCEEPEFLHRRGRPEGGFPKRHICPCRQIPRHTETKRVSLETGFIYFVVVTSEVWERTILGDKIHFYGSV